ncbi:MAG: hypothetical protein A3G39_09180 [Deltaproteobacteria bacterium RIFCSPLOWO2_12_FULL_43_16]|nr:MAG: hypothetical protein A2Z89_05465 [Deltaproteobacteria bacterium GWA2_43_19]OGQ12575.1 MAG: hypothetical protein A3D30_10605 [Deltaproteobacteria bacterium RIFCSPHIGHO2_02_FULL_43_33]OGQ56847.1 MAG: hypothetical protein A3G39_09180 [Deltaproteobacteria bacterium RIFCSPLOWO2_12_FULL_43_16]HBR17990.1 hypothetical protein [Deltaproteobacteria bacterium]
MAEQVVCSNCNKSFFTAASHGDLPCPHCNYIISLNRVDKRLYPRVSGEVPFSLALSDSVTPATALNVSIDGIGIKLSGMHDISIGKILDIHIPELGINTRAKVVWQKIYQKGYASETHIGARFL